MKKIYSIFVLVLFAVGLKAQHIRKSPAFQLNQFTNLHEDKELSPYTGYTRESWKDVARYLLKGAFSYISRFDDPMEFPKQPGKSYPNDGKINRTERLEGLCRTLFLAAPLLRENPDIELNHIKLADYYQHQLRNLVNPSSDTYIQPQAENGGPSQILVEFGALSISLFTAPEVLWDPLPQTTKDSLAYTMLSYGNGPTIQMNWRFFNIFVMSFFKSKGYPVKEDYLVELVHKCLADYKGSGWYNDSPYYDYYSMWGFQLYGVLWSAFFGNKYYPSEARQFSANFDEAKGNYPYMFGQNGHMIMWGRSISYRLGSAGLFPLMGLRPDSSVNYGWMRRIASGTIRQFIDHPDFLKDNVPVLGFYGPFEPAVQPYSCRGSVYWMGKLFLGLILPSDNPFWTAKENEGPWTNEMQSDKVYNRFQQGSDILITDYPAIGAAEIRAWCQSKTVGYYQGTENYDKLAYNSAFPWQADGKNGEISMNYTFKNLQNEWEALRYYTFKKFENGVYYRDAVLASDDAVRLRLADIPLPNGILRVDKNVSTSAGTVRLGHYALPELDGPLEEREITVKGKAVKIIDNGQYQLALVPFSGWEKAEVVQATGLHPMSPKSSVINTEDHFSANESKYYITLMLWKKSGEPFSKKELILLKSAKEVGEDEVLLSLRDKNIKIDF